MKKSLWQKGFAGFLCVCLLLLAIPPMTLVTLAEGESITVDGTTVTISGYATGADIIAAISEGGAYADVDLSQVTTVKIDTCTNLGAFVVSNVSQWKNYFPAATVLDLSETAITNTGNRLFLNQNTLQKIFLPSTLTSIGMYVFEGCSALTTVSVDPTDDNIVDLSGFAETFNSTLYSAFKSCVKIENVVLHPNMTALGDTAFQQCTGLKSVVLHEGFKSLGNRSLGGLSNNAAMAFTVTIPDTIETIPALAFDRAVGYTVKYAGTNDAVQALLLSPTGFISASSGTKPIYDFSGSDVTAEQIEKLGEFTGYADRVQKIILTGCEQFLGYTPAAGSVLATLNAAGKVEWPKLEAKIELSDNGATATIKNYASAADIITAINALQNKDAITKVIVDCPLVSDFSALAHSANKGGWAVQSTAWGVLFPNMVELDLSGTSMEEVSNRYFGSSTDAQINEVIKKVTLPGTVTYLGQRAFQGCSALEEVYFEESAAAASMSTYVFMNCANLKTVVLPSNMTALSDGAFQGCGALQNVTFPQNLKTIGGTFMYSGTYANAPVFTLPNTITSIGQDAFKNNGNFTVAYHNTDAASMQTFLNNLFGATGCLVPTAYNVSNVTLDFSGSAMTPAMLEGLSSVTNYATKIKKVIVTDIDAFLDINPTEAGVVKTLFDAGKLEYDITPADIAVENGVATITRFETAQDLANAILGLNGVTADVDVDTPEERALITKVIVNCPALTDLSLFAMSKSVSNVWSVQDTAWGVMFPNMVELDLSGTSMEEVSNRYFGSSTDAQINEVIKKVTLPGTVTYLGQRAFQGCSALEEVTVLPGTVTATMSTYTFCNATNLKTVTLPSGLEVLNECAFQGAYSLETINWPTNLTTISKLAFGYWTLGTAHRVELPSTVTSVHAEAFRNSSNMTIVVNSQTNATLTGALQVNDNTVLELAGKLGDMTEKGIYVYKNGVWEAPTFVMQGAKSAERGGVDGVLFGALLENSVIMDRIVEAGALAIPYKQISSDYAALTKDLQNNKLLSTKFDANALAAACEEAVSGKKDIEMNFTIWNLPTTSNAKIAATMYVVYEVADTQVVLYAQNVDDVAGDGAGVASPNYVFN